MEGLGKCMSVRHTLTTNVCWKPHGPEWTGPGWRIKLLEAKRKDSSHKSDRTRFCCAKRFVFTFRKVYIQNVYDNSECMLMSSISSFVLGTRVIFFCHEQLVPVDLGFKTISWDGKFSGWGNGGGVLFVLFQNFYF